MGTEKPNEFKAPAITQRAREPGKCWRCGDNWFHGHKCKQAPAINLLVGEEVEEPPPEQEILDENGPSDQGAAEEQCMKISLQAMQADSVNTLSISVNIGGKIAIALVDSGSNSTFMSLQFVLQTSCNIFKDKS
jgi:hypothetical protein